MSFIKFGEAFALQARSESVLHCSGARPSIIPNSLPSLKGNLSDESNNRQRQKPLRNCFIYSAICSSICTYLAVTNIYWSMIYTCRLWWTVLTWAYLLICTKLGDPEGAGLRRWPQTVFVFGAITCMGVLIVAAFLVPARSSPRLLHIRAGLFVSPSTYMTIWKSMSPSSQVYIITCTTKHKDGDDLITYIQTDINRIKRVPPI